MDSYPASYVLHNRPFLVLSGLGARSELDPDPVRDVFSGQAVTSISSDAPPVADQRADGLLEDFLSYDATNASSEGSLTRFRIRAVGRVGQAPQIAYAGGIGREIHVLARQKYT
jgi:hypothetical protein